MGQAENSCRVRALQPHTFRYMSAAGLERKCDIKAYVEKASAFSGPVIDAPGGGSKSENKF